MNTLGKWGELLAQQYLRKNSCRIVKNNFRSSEGEVDIIYIESSVLVFAEVKMWQYYRCPELKYVISYAKRRRMMNTARFFLTKYCVYNELQVRFDIILILMPRLTVHHFKNVFE